LVTLRDQVPEKVDTIPHSDTRAESGEAIGDAGHGPCVAGEKFSSEFSRLGIEKELPIFAPVSFLEDLDRCRADLYRFVETKSSSHNGGEDEGDEFASHV
jgi:hypothetical protein